MAVAYDLGDSLSEQERGELLGLAGDLERLWARCYLSEAIDWLCFKLTQRFKELGSRAEEVDERHLC